MSTGYVLTLPDGALMRLGHPRLVTREAVELRTGQRVASLQSDDGFEYPVLKDGRFGIEGDDLPPGSYRVLCVPDALFSSISVPQSPLPLPSDALPAPLTDIARAFVATTAQSAVFNNHEDLLAVLRAHGDAHDFVTAVVSRPDAPLRILVGVSPDVVVVSVDCPAFHRHLLHPGAPLPYMHGHIHSSAAVLAQTLPLQTLIGLCTDPHALDSYNYFHFVEHDDSSKQDDHSSPLSVHNASPAGKKSPQPVRSLGTRALAALHLIPPRAPSPSSISDTGSNISTPASRQLLVCGSSLSGVVAHVFALQARQEVQSRGLGLTVSCVTFGSPFFASSGVAAELQQTNSLQQHVNICNKSDACLDAMNLCIRVSAAQAVSGDPNFKTDEFVGFVDDLVTYTSDSELSNALEHYLALYPTAMRMADNHLSSANGAFSSTGYYSFCTLGQDKMATHLLEEECEKVLARIEKTRLNIKAHRVIPLDLKFCEKAVWAYSSETSLLTVFAPKIDQCNIVQTPLRAEFVFTGMGLESVCSRVAVFRPSGIVQEPEALVFDDLAFTISEGGSATLVNRTNPTEARLTVVGCSYVGNGKGTIILRTLFGDSAPFVIQKEHVHSSDEMSLAAMLHSRMDAQMLHTVFLRGILSATDRRARHPSLSQREHHSTSSSSSSTDRVPFLDNDHLTLLADLEDILLGTRTLYNTVQEFLNNPSNGPEHIAYLIKPANRVINQIVSKMSEPLRIEYHSAAVRGLKKLLNGIGLILGSVLAVVGAIASLPGALLMLPGIVQMARSANSATAQNPAGEVHMSGGALLLFIPGALAAIPGTAVLAVGGLLAFSSKKGLDRNPLDHQYGQTIKLLLTILGADPTQILDEVPPLEAALERVYSRASGGAPLYKTSEKDIEHTLENLAKRGHDSNIKAYTSAQSSSQKQLRMWYQAVGRVGRMRALLERQFVLSFIGVHNAGKSTLISNLFKVDANSDLLQRTEYPQLFSTTDTDLYQSSESLPLSLHIIDFPGTTDERPHVSQMTQQFSDVSTILVCVFAAGHIAEPERLVVTTAKQAKRDFIVLINKSDTIQHELVNREEDIRNNYATILGVPSEIIFFVQAHKEASVAMVRCILWRALRCLLPDVEGAETALAFAMIPKPTRQHLQQKYPTQEELLSSAIVSILGDMQSITEDSIELRLDSIVRGIALNREASLPGSSAPAVPALVADLLAAMGFQMIFIVPTLEGLMTLDVFKGLVDKDFMRNQLSGSSRRSLSVSSISQPPPAQRSNLEAEQVHLIATAITVLAKVNAIKEATAPINIDPAVLDAALCRWLRSGDTDDIEGFKRMLLEEHLAPSANPQKAAAAEQAAAAEGVAAATSSGAVVARGFELLSSLKMGVRFRPVARLQRGPVEVYGEFDPNLSFQGRTALFREMLRKQRIGYGEEHHLTVDPDAVFDSLVSALSGVVRREELRDVIRIRLSSSVAVDVNGVFRGVMTEAGNHLRDRKSPFFFVSEDGQVFFGGPEAHRETVKAAAVYRAVGRMVGLVLANSTGTAIFPAQLALPVFKIILGEYLDLNDLELLDKGITSSIKQVCLMDSRDIADLELRFSVDMADGPPCDLVAGGSEIPVSSNNRLSYLEKLVRFHLGGDVPIDQFVMGIQDACPREYLTIFTPQMLQLLVNGCPNVTADDLAGITIGNPEPSPANQLWFRECVAEMSNDERALLLVFITGSPSLPPGGLACVQPKLTVVRSMRDANSLPTSHTCFNRLDLPPYDSKDTMMKQLRFSISNTAAGEYGML